MAQELVPPPAKDTPEGHVHCEDFEGDDPCPRPEHEHCHAAGDCDWADCQLDCDATTDDMKTAVELIVRFTRATRG